MKAAGFQPKIPAMTSTLGQTVKNRLAQLQKTQEWLAEQAGVSTAAVSKWIRTGNISRGRVVRVAESLGITADQLLNGANAPAPRSDLVKLSAIHRRIISLYEDADDRGKLEMLAAIEEISKDISDERRRATLASDREQTQQLGLVDRPVKARSN